MALVIEGQGKTTQVGIPYEARKGKDDVPALKDATPEQVDKLDSDKYQERFKDLLRYRRQARIAHASNREQMAIDEDYYDGIQLDAEDLAVLDERGQPANYFNVTKNTLNYLLGVEKASRIDYSIKPRKKMDASGAKAKNKVIKYVEDVNHGEYARSAAFADAVKAGVGWLEEGVRSDEDEEPLYCRHEDWRNMWFDNLGREPDMSDWRYVLREKWVDLDVATNMFPERKEVLEVLASGVNSLYPYLPDDVVIQDNASEFDVEADFDALLGGAYDGLRERIKLCEMWYRVPQQVRIIQMRGDDTPYGALHGSIFRPEDEAHRYLVQGRYATLYDAKKMVVRCAMWAGATYLQDVLTPYNHNRFPFIPIFCYRFKRDGMPYGVIRDIRSPQDDLNKRRNKSLFMLTASKVIMEDGAVNNPAAFLDEFNRPDCLAIVNKGAMSSGAIKIIDNMVLSKEHLEMARDSERFIHNITGVQAEMQGQSQRDLSGKAINALHNQGSMTAGPIFDNYYYAFQLAGEIRLSNIEQYYDQQKEFRITGDQRVDEFMEINKRNPETGEIENSILRSKADFIVGKQDYRETMRIAARDMMSEMITKMPPEVGLKLLDMVVDLYDDLNGKDEIVARIRQINGQSAPDDEMSPEEKAAKQQAMQAKQAEMAKVKGIQDEMLQLTMREKEATIAVKEADAQAKQTKALLNSMEASLKRVTQFIKALESAGMVSLAPELVGAADTIIEEADVIGDDHLPKVGQKQPQVMPQQISGQGGLPQ